jgi:putative (di)nucleoside polyphosphate hydrolase
LNRDGHVFVAQRIDAASDAWQLPQGGIHAGEKPRTAVMRELAEEIGTDRAVIIGKAAEWLTYDLPADLAARVWGGRYRGQRQRWYALLFTGTDRDIDLAASGDPEFLDWRWVACETLPGLAISFKRQLYERLVAEFAPLVSALARATDTNGQLGT